jgi:voltage-gated potassium channel
VLGAISMLMGVGMFAMPAGILASGFAQEIKGRDFVIEWRMVAKVPIFGRLEATLITDIVSMLRPRMAMQGEIIMREGEKGDCMYFIASGECEVDAVPRPIALG